MYHWNKVPNWWELQRQSGGRLCFNATRTHAFSPLFFFLLSVEPTDWEWERVCSSLQSERCTQTEKSGVLFYCPQNVFRKGLAPLFPPPPLPLCGGEQQIPLPLGPLGPQHLSGDAESLPAVHPGGQAAGAAAPLHCSLQISPRVFFLSLLLDSAPDRDDGQLRGRRRRGRPAQGRAGLLHSGEVRYFLYFGIPDMHVCLFKFIAAYEYPYLHTVRRSYVCCTYVQ